MQTNSSYLENISALRNEREITRQELSKITKAAERVLGIFNGIITETMVSVDELRLFKIGEKVNLSVKVFFVKYYEDAHKMKFHTFLKPGGRYGVHEHDCKETTTIVKGHLIELLASNKVYEAGSVITYEPNVLHEPYCTEESQYDVTFEF